MDEYITKLEPNQRFVFGSNLRGQHIGGAAFQAKEQFGAVDGVGEGLTGQCYAFPTLDEMFRPMPHFDLESIVCTFYRCATAHYEFTFLLTKVGCGIAHMDEGYMKSLFIHTPSNIIKPKGW